MLHRVFWHTSSPGGCVAGYVAGRLYLAVASWSWECAAQRPCGANIAATELGHEHSSPAPCAQLHVCLAGAWCC